MTIASIIGLLEAFAEGPSNATMNLHDFNGEILKTARLWCATRDIELRHSTVEFNDATFDTFQIRMANGAELTVFDHLSKRTTVSAGDSTWRPGEVCQ